MNELPISYSPLLPEQIEQYMVEQNCDDTTKEMVRKYYPIAWGKPSPYLERNAIVQNWYGLMEHARGAEIDRVKNSRLTEREQRNANRAARLAKNKSPDIGVAWIQWQKDCTARNAWIESLNAEWRKRIADRKVAMASWDAHVEQARAAYQAGKAIPAPPQPDCTVITHNYDGTPLKVAP